MLQRHSYSSESTYPFKGGDDDISWETVITFSKNKTKESSKRPCNSRCTINQQNTSKGSNETVDLEINKHYTINIV